MNPKVVRLFFTLFLLGLVIEGSAATPYPAPEPGDPLNSPWCWNEIEILRNRDIILGTEDSKGMLWFVNLTSIISYDGYNVTEIPFPEEFQGIPSIDLLVSDNGRFFVYLRKALLLYDNGQWTVLDRYTLPTLRPRKLLIETQNNHVFGILPRGFVEISGNDLVDQNEGSEPPDLYLANTSTDLWIKILNELIRIPLQNGAIHPNQKRVAYDASMINQTNEWNGLAANPQGDVVVTSTSQTLNPHIWDQKQQTFVETDLVVQTGNLSVSDPAYVGKSQQDLLLHGKSSMFVYRENALHRIKLQPWMPSNNRYIINRKNGDLIIGGKYERIYEIDYSENRWKLLKGVHFECEGMDQTQWFLSFEGKVLQYFPDTNEWMLHDDARIDGPLSIFCSNDGTIWVAGAHSGTAAVSYYTGSKWEMHIHPSLMSSIGHMSTIQTQKGDVLFGSGHEPYTSIGGLVKYEQYSNGWRFSYLGPPTVPSRIVGLIENQNDLWFSGINLAKYSEEAGTEYIDLPEAQFDWVDSMISDSNANIWVGIWGNGVFKWDGSDWSNFSGPDFISSNHVTHMQFDSMKEEIWFATTLGISRYSLRSNIWVPRAINFPEGLQREGGTLKIDSTSNLWINRADRRWYFRNRYPFKFSKGDRDEFQTVRYTPDSSVPRVEIQKHVAEIKETESITLSWNGKDAYSFTKNEDLNYSHRINGDIWSAYASTQQISVNELNPGTYTIEIKCRDQDGNISDVVASTFQVKSVFWKKESITAAIIVLVILLIGMIIFTVWLKIQQLIQLENFKLQFFTNISHELRTPLTAIIGPLEQLLRNPTSATKDKLDIPHRNAKKMLNLVDQLLEFRKHNQGFGENHYSHLNVIECLREIVQLNQPIAAEKSLTFTATFEASETLSWFDRNKLERITDNILLNAIKYTPKQGEVKIHAALKETENNQELLLTVEDNGPGISPLEIKQIFEPYYRAHNNPQLSVKGTGLGLALVKTLVDSMDGSISVKSPISQSNGVECGSRFTITLPMPLTIKDASVIEPKHALATSHPDDDSRNDEANNTNKPKLLIVEDDADILTYLTSELTDEFSVKTACNGKEGILAARKHLPDVILLDVMMPDTDGYHACKVITENAETSHIPVVFLSALKGDEHILKGLECGAEEFLNKPINSYLLKQRLLKLLEMRKKLKQSILKDKRLPSSKSTDNTHVDHPFVERIENTILNNLESPEFDTEILAQKLNMSRITLYRKFKASTGANPSAYIKEIRIKKAAEFLKTNQFTVAEVADKVGFQGSSYLIATFKATYGCTPKQFQLKNR